MVGWDFATVGVLAIAASCDLSSREIPDLLPVTLLATASLRAILTGGLPEFLSLTLGAVVAFTLGAILFALQGFGGGDVKLLGSLGAAFGLSGLAPVLFWIALAGGLHSGIALVRGQREIPYAPAMLVGTVIAIFLRQSTP